MEKNGRKRSGVNSSSCRVIAIVCVSTCVRARAWSRRSCLHAIHLLGCCRYVGPCNCPFIRVESALVTQLVVIFILQPFHQGIRGSRPTAAHAVIVLNMLGKQNGAKGGINSYLQESSVPWDVSEVSRDRPMSLTVPVT